MAPYESDPRAWEGMEWTDIYSGRVYEITTGDERLRSDLVRVKSYRGVLSEHRRHPESKSLGSDGRPCRRGTRGLLARRPVRLGSLHYIGKESNRLEDVEKGTVHQLSEVLTEYRDPERDEWSDYVVPILREIPKAALAEAAAIHPRKVAAIRNEQARPRSEHRLALLRAAASYARRALSDLGHTAPGDPLAACRAFVAAKEGSD